MHMDLGRLHKLNTWNIFSISLHSNLICCLECTRALKDYEATIIVHEVSLESRKGTAYNNFQGDKMCFDCFVILRSGIVELHSLHCLRKGTLWYNHKSTAPGRQSSAPLSFGVMRGWRQLGQGRGKEGVGVRFGGVIQRNPRVRQ